MRGIEGMLGQTSERMNKRTTFPTNLKALFFGNRKMTLKHHVVPSDRDKMKWRMLTRIFLIRASSLAGVVSASGSCSLAAKLSVSYTVADASKHSLCSTYAILFRKSFSFRVASSETRCDSEPLMSASSIYIRPLTPAFRLRPAI